MTDRPTTEHELLSWLEATGRTPLPTNVDDLLARTARARQRPAWSFPERWIPVNITAQAPTIAGRQPSLRLVALVALLLLALAAGALLVAGARQPVPPPFGPASNGLVAYVTPTEGVPSGDCALYRSRGDIVNVDPVTGTTSTRVGGPEIDERPVYSLDGTRLAFVRASGAGQVLDVVSRSGEIKTLTPMGLPEIQDVAWSPDGRSIAFVSPEGDRWHLWIAHPDDGRVARVPMDPDLSVVSPQWRPPDGGQILLVGARAGGLMPRCGYRDLWGTLENVTATGQGLFLVDPSGNGLRPVTDADGLLGDFAHLGWTPDGSLILTQGPVGPYGYGRVRVLRSDGSELRVLEPTSGYETLAPSVSPDGRSVAYADLGQGDAWHLRVQPIDGSAPPSDLAEFVGGGASYAWSPDGRTILVTHQYFHETWLVDVAARTRTRASWTDMSDGPAWQRVAP